MSRSLCCQSYDNYENYRHTQGRPLDRSLYDGHVLVLCILPYIVLYVVQSPLSTTI
jgi:hypothetical protein